jgi:hypothetical protein
MGKFKLRNGSGNATPFKLMADMGFTSETEGGPGSGIFPTPKEGGPKKKQGAESQVIDPYKGKRSQIVQEFVNPSFDTNVDYSSLSSESVIEEAKQRGSQKYKPKKSKLDDVKTAIIQSNFVKKQRELSMALRNKFYGTKLGKNKPTYNEMTPWENYRDAIKDEKQKIREETDPFSKERRLRKQDLRGKFDSTGRRLSLKNKYQQNILKDRHRGNNPKRGKHNPHIPEFKNRVSFAEWRQNRKNQKEKAAGGVKTGGCTPSGGKFTGNYKGKSTDTFGHGSQCGPGGI